MKKLIIASGMSFIFSMASIASDTRAQVKARYENALNPTLEAQQLQLRNKRDYLIEEGLEAYFGFYGGHDYEAAKPYLTDSVRIDAPFNSLIGCAFQSIVHLILFGKYPPTAISVEELRKKYSHKPEAWYFFALLAHINNNSDYKDSFNLFKAAADRGHIRAQYYTAIYYLNGLGTLRNITTGIKYLILAKKLPAAHRLIQKIVTNTYFENLSEEIARLRTIQSSEERKIAGYYLNTIEPNYETQTRRRALSLPAQLTADKPQENKLSKEDLQRLRMLEGEEKDLFSEIHAQIVRINGLKNIIEDKENELAILSAQEIRPYNLKNNSRARSYSSFAKVRGEHNSFEK
jgi:TPR repeat protein